MPDSTPNPSLAALQDHDHPLFNSSHLNGSPNGIGNIKLRVPLERRYVSPEPHANKYIPCLLSARYYAKSSAIEWPPSVLDYNARFTRMLEAIKRRHDPTVTTVAQGVLEWKRSQNAKNIGLDIQAWLDRFYLSRIGIRFLIGQRAFIFGLSSLV